MNSTPTPRRRKPRFLPEIVVAGLVLSAGAWFWSHNLTPDTPFAPRIAQAQDAQDAPAPEAPAPKWKDAPAAEAEAAEKIIVAQLEAFKADDWDKAITYQSEGLKQNFASPEQFKAVIKGNYPQFAEYKEVKFGKARMDGPLLQVQVVLTGKDDVQLAALYSMIKEEIPAKDGKPAKKGEAKIEYRVSGVTGGEAERPDARVA